MSIKVSIFHAELLRAIRNPEAICVEGKTVGDCLEDLIRQYPVSEKYIFDKQRQLLRQVNVFVNVESLHKTKLAAPVKDGDNLIIALLVSGG
jgi:molybdopterin converting factor small subunit